MRRRSSTKIPAATNARTFRTFLLVQAFEAREIGARIAQARKERSLTQEQLAEIGSFSKRSLQDYENGVTIPYRHLRELSRLLGRDPEWFLHGDGAAAEWDRLADLEAEVRELRDELAASQQRAEEQAGRVAAALEQVARVATDASRVLEELKPLLEEQKAVVADLRTAAADLASAAGAG